MPPTRRRPTLWSLLAFLGLTLPWLNPFAPGPTPTVLPWLMALVGFACMLPWAARARVHQLGALAASAWLLAALVSAVLGLLQYFGASGALAPWVNPTDLGQAYANLRQRNQFATLTNIGLAALLWWQAQGFAAQGLMPTPGQVARPAWQIGAALAAAVLLALGNAASSSRTGMVQLLLLTLLATLWRVPGRGWRQSALALMLTAVLVYAGAALALPLLLLLGQDLQTVGMLARLQQGDPACASRLTLWANVLHLIALKPWLGWGWGELDYAHFITLYPGLRFCAILDNAHNLPLQLAVELGLPLALAVCAAALWLVRRAQPWRERDATRQLAWAVLALMLLHSLLEYPLWYGPFQVAAGLSVWLLWRQPAGTARFFDKIFKPFRALAHVLPVFIAIAIIAMAAYAAWDYQRVSQLYLSPELRAQAYRVQPLDKITRSGLFQDQLRFATLTTTALNPANAQQLHQQALAMLHFSPEPRVIEKLIDSAMLLGRFEQAQFYQLRYQAAFPENAARRAPERPVNPSLAPFIPISGTAPAEDTESRGNPHRL